MYRKTDFQSFGPIIIIIVAFSVVVTLITQSVDFFLNFNIMVFALIEGVSTYVQVIDNRNIIRFRHLQTEIEKCYGPLMSILTNPDDELVATQADGKKDTWSFFEQRVRGKINSIFEQFPHLIPLNIYSIWAEDVRWNETKDGGMEIHESFIREVLNEYESRVDEYRRFIKKET